ncbi:hypothetical protein Leryth_023427 [Lithospermum erythrorhizon]|nr:hypothetical protein Leryth_023427 [Lithospermum erythrorhizon]
MAKDKNCNCRDQKDNGNKEVHEEQMARESLISLSYTEPPKDPATGGFPDNLRGQCSETPKLERAERNRSELISMSCSPSQEAPALKN